MSRFIEVMSLDYILRKWSDNPQLPKKTYAGVFSWQDGSLANELPLNSTEVQEFKHRMRFISPTRYYILFPEESASDKSFADDYIPNDEVIGSVVAEWKNKAKLAKQEILISVDGRRVGVITFLSDQLPIVDAAIMSVLCHLPGECLLPFLDPIHFESVIMNLLNKHTLIPRCGMLSATRIG